CLYSLEYEQINVHLLHNQTAHAMRHEYRGSLHQWTTVNSAHVAVLLIIQIKEIEKLLGEFRNTKHTPCGKDIAEIGIVAKGRNANIRKSVIFMEKIRPECFETVMGPGFFR